MNTLGGQYIGGSAGDPALERLTGQDATSNPAFGYLQTLAGEGPEYLRPTARGDFREEGNPYLASLMENIKSTVLPGIASQFSEAGRYGSNMFADTSARAATESLAPFAFQNYENERNRELAAANSLGGFQLAGAQNIGQLEAGDRSRQLGAAGQLGGEFSAERNRMQSAMGFAPDLAGEDYRDIAALRGVGSQIEGQTQAGISEDIARHNFEQLEPRDRLAAYMQLIGGNFGGTSQGTTTSTTPYYQQSPWMDAAGLGLSAAGAAGGLGLGK